MKVREELTNKYSTDEHEATKLMANELGVGKRILFLVGNMGTMNLDKVIDTEDWELKISTYSDFRVDPQGFVSVNQRFDDLFMLYEGRDHVLADRNKTLQKRDLCLKLEMQIQPNISISLSELPSQKLYTKADELMAYEI